MDNVIYCVAENNGRWIETKATTLAGAKRAASRAQMSQGSDVFVAIKRESVDGGAAGYDVVAKKLHRHALDMNATGGWQEVG